MTDDLTPNGPLVVCLVSDELLSFEFGIAYEVFGLPRPEFGQDWYRFETAAVKPGFIKSSGDLSVYVQNGLELIAEADLVIIPGWPDVSSPVASEVVDALQAAYDKGARIASLCSGVVVLAETGLLDNRTATTHWRFVDLISEKFPLIHFDPDVLYVDDGRTLTAAGSAAGMDLCIHIVRQKYGVEKANIVAQGLVMPSHRNGGQSQVIPKPVPKEYESCRIGQTIEKMLNDLGGDISVKELAKEAGMSLRTFQRRFEAHTGCSPSAWILNERLRLACEILEQEADGDLEDIAMRSGFCSLATMRHHFRQRLNVSPSAYRSGFVNRQ
ncbi:MAG: helix-turn-helix domain-containing protein, partial [Pseudomonadota bacterium]